MQIVPVSALRDNYIWALTEAHHCVVVDPGDGVPVERFLQETGRILTAILLTHHHDDHVAGIDLLRTRHAVPVFGPTSPLMPQVNRLVSDNDKVFVPGISTVFRVLAVPGHTQEHMAWLSGEALFCGDTMFGGGCGRLLGGTAEQLHTSLQRLAALPAATRVFCAHEYTLANLRFASAVEPENEAIAQRVKRCEALRRAGMATLPSTIEEELATNPFLRVREAKVKAAAENAAGCALVSDVEVFTALRQWKDRFS